jgi:hypothetical protein
MLSQKRRGARKRKKIKDLFGVEFEKFFKKPAVEFAFCKKMPYNKNAAKFALN